MVGKTQNEQLAAEMDKQLSDIQEQAYSKGWQDVAIAADRARCALRRRLHPEDLATADAA